MTRCNLTLVFLFLVVTATFQQLLVSADESIGHVPGGGGFENATLAVTKDASNRSAVDDALFANGSMTLTTAAVNASLSDNNNIIPGQYIVFYKKNADRPSFSTAQQQNRLPFRIIREFRKAIAVADLEDEQYQQLLEDPTVEKIVPDFTITLDSFDRSLFQTSQVSCAGLIPSTACPLSGKTQNSPANWGLDRIDQNNLPLNQAYTTRCDGARVQVYILDTGIRRTHVEFGGRASCGANFVIGEDCQDYDGHGTHVAGTVGGATFGVAKQVELISVKVFNRDGSGSLSAVLAGIDHVVTQKNRNPTKPMVINMSLGSPGTSTEIKNAVDEAVAAGVVVVVAAGNQGTNACNYSPAFVPNAITVGATDQQDARPTFSNFGSCVDLSAPGVSIVSASFRNDQYAAILSGTSMAAPHVAGAAALYLQSNPDWTPAQVWQAMREDSTTAGSVGRFLQIQYI